MALARLCYELCNFGVGICSQVYIALVYILCVWVLCTCTFACGKFELFSLANGPCLFNIVYNCCLSAQLWISADKQIDVHI